MKKLLVLLLLSGIFSAAWATDNPTARIQTNMGEIVLELYPDKAPETVSNFIQYVNDGYYSGTIFHRVISGFMIQGGGFTTDYSRKSVRDPVKNEADNGLGNDRGTIAMARTADPHSATAQFFINVTDNPSLNYSSPDQRGWGYCVFGKVIEGMDVVDRIRTIPTGAGGPFANDVPQTPAVIEEVSMVKTQ